MGGGTYSSLVAHHALVSKRRIIDSRWTSNTSNSISEKDYSKERCNRLRGTERIAGRRTEGSSKTPATFLVRSSIAENQKAHERAGSEGGTILNEHLPVVCLGIARKVDGPDLLAAKRGKQVVQGWRYENPPARQKKKEVGSEGKEDQK